MSRDNRIRFNTAALRKKIEQNKMSVESFTRKISKITGVNAATVKTHVQGRYRPQKNEMDAYAEVLKMPVSEIYSIFSDGTGPVKTMEFNYDALEKIVKDSKYSKSEVCRILGININSFCSWKKSTSGPKAPTLQKLCELFKIEPATLFKEGTRAASPTEKTESKHPALETLEFPTGMTGFKQIETMDILENFRIINENILLLAKNLDMMAKLDESRYESMKGQFDQLTESVKALDVSHTRTSKPVATISRRQQPRQTVVVGHIDSLLPKEKTVKEEIEELCNSYDKNDDFDKYNKKINRMVALINTKTKDTHKQTLHKFYKEMENTYGVNFTDLGVRFRAKNNRKNSGSIELLYMEEIYRQIFYNIIATRLSHIIEEKAPAK